VYSIPGSSVEGRGFFMGKFIVEVGNASKVKGLVVGDPSGGSPGVDGSLLGSNRLRGRCGEDGRGGGDGH